MASAPATMTGAMPDDGLPVVASRKPDRLGLATGLAIVAFLGLAVFWILNAGREAENSANPVVAAVDPAQRISSPPPLAKSFPSGENVSGPLQSTALSNLCILLPAATSQISILP